MFYLYSLSVSSLLISQVRDEYRTDYDPDILQILDGKFFRYIFV